MIEFAKGAILSLVINALTVVGWLYIGMWLPSITNALVALLVAGLWGLDDEWAFPIGYWTVQVLAVVAWLTLLSYGGLSL